MAAIKNNFFLRFSGRCFVDESAAVVVAVVVVVVGIDVTNLCWFLLSIVRTSWSLIDGTNLFFFNTTATFVHVSKLTCYVPTFL